MTPDELSTLYMSLDKNLEGLEKSIMTTKRSKDLNDYKLNKVYEWRSQNTYQKKKNQRTPKSILKNNKNVSFPSSSEGDTSDIFTDVSDAEGELREPREFRSQTRQKTRVNNVNGAQDPNPASTSSKNDEPGAKDTPGDTMRTRYGKKK